MRGSYRPAPRITTLGGKFYDVVEPAHFPRHVLRFRNDRWSVPLGLGDFDAEAWEAAFARFAPLEGNLQSPLALRYHGHQFDVYNPQIGDGRAFLFAQMLCNAGPGPTAGAEDRFVDLGTKGSGQTPWSRGGDGRLTLKGGVREVLATEMLEALGVPTSKTFSLFETGEELVRGDEPSPTRSCVLVRLSHSHVRFGTFQRLAYLDDAPASKKLFEYVVENLYPSMDGTLCEPAALLREIVVRTADLCAAWMVSGFVHGVLNSDNMNVTGEGFDYGPYRFLPAYNPSFVAAYFDHGGLYAFGRQPEAVFRNLARLAESMTSLAPRNVLADALRAYEPHLGEAARRRFLARLGVASVDVETDAILMGAAFDLLEESTRPGSYDQFFFDWYGGVASEARAREGPTRDDWRGERFDAFRRALDHHTPLHPERLAMPYFQRPRPCTLLIDEIESLWSSIAGLRGRSAGQPDREAQSRDDDCGDWGPFEAKIASIREMNDTLALATDAPRYHGHPRRPRP